ncbi:MAG TPA: helix-turn-helix transcriptional regulator [Caulifigura sp.]|jgi:transcriptional regulator with XRE-family HTH domain|nr:helix-turn-helix transcriptional regulator [Caulifigura sp.]
MFEAVVYPNGPEIKRLRKVKNWTQRRLADAAGYSKRTIETAEAGNRVSEYTISCIAEALGVESDEITAQGPPSEVSSQPRETDRRELMKATTGLWYASGVQERGTGRRPLNFTFKLVFKLDGAQLTGRFAVDYADRDRPLNWRFVTSAHYRVDRYLQVECETDNPAILNFNTWILQMNPEGDTLTGRYVGFGPRTRDLVFGTLTLTRVPSRFHIGRGKVGPRKRRAKRRLPE